MVTLKKTVIINTTYIAEVEEELLKDTGNHSIWNHFDDDLSLVIRLYSGIEAEHESSSMVVLDSSSMNCGRCVICNRWITDKSRADFVEGLCKSYFKDNIAYCSECYQFVK